MPHTSSCKVEIWYTTGTCDRLNLGRVAAKEPARQIQSYVDAKSDPDKDRDQTSVLASEVGYTGKHSIESVLLPTFDFSCPCNISCGLLVGDVFCEGVTDHCTLLGSAGSPLLCLSLSVHTTSAW